MRSPAYEMITRLARMLLRLFFRRVEVTGLENIPADGGGIVVSWHPNGMIDPALIFETFPRHIVFGARHGLFKVPILGWLMKAVGTVPIYRAQDTKRMDEDARRVANKKSLDALSDRIVDGSFSALFPEGVSHDAPHLKELKTGVARFYYRARQRLKDDSPVPVIIPVGLHYDQKRLFRSKVLVAYHPPVSLPPDLAITPPEDDPKKVRRERYRRFTDEIERVLREVVHATETWEVHYLMHRARKIMRAERAHRADSSLSAPTMEERTRGLSRIWMGYYARLDSHPDEVAVLLRRVEEYDADLRALQMEDHELDRPPPLVRLGLATYLVLQVVFVYLFLPPILIVGVLVNLPAALLLMALTRWAAKMKKDEASIKVLAGAVVLPLTWIGAGFVAGWAHSQIHDVYPAIPDTFVLAGLLVSLLSFAGGAIAMRYLRIARETARAVRVRLTRERRRLTIARLRVDRGELHDALVTLAEGLELPGTVEDDGRVGPSLAPSGA